MMGSYIKPYQRRKYELCCNIAVYIYIENRLFSPLLACFSIFVVVFGGFQFASEFTIVTVIVCFPGGLCFGETEATLCVSFVTVLPQHNIQLSLLIRGPQFWHWYFDTLPEKISNTQACYNKIASTTKHLHQTNSLIRNDPVSEDCCLWQCL